MLVFRHRGSFLFSLIVVLSLASMMSPVKANDSFSYQLESKLNVSVFNLNKLPATAISELHNHPAVNFNHKNQRIVDYLFSVILAIFIVAAVRYYWIKLTILPPPWYLSLNRHSRLMLAGWKASNLVYKARSHHQD